MKTKKLLFMAIAILGFAFTTMAQVPPYVPTNGLVGWWPFTGNANDLSINGNNGTNNGATLTTDRFGNINTAYYFDGVNDNIVTNLSSYFILNGQFTFSCWINPAQLTKTIIQFYPSINQGIDIGIGTVDHAVHINVFNGGWQNIASINTLTIGYWVHVVAINDGANSKIYFDGIVNITGTLPYCSNSSNKKLNIGYHEAIADYFNGKIDDIGIWDRVLTQQEITDLYNATPTAINEVNNINSFKVYPNPATSQINVQANAGLVGSSYTITDQLGKTVLIGKLNAENTLIELGNLSGGVYVFNVGGSKQGFKVIKN